MKLWKSLILQYKKNVENKLRKIFFTLPSEEDETYTAFVQVAGFKSEEEAQMYLKSLGGNSLLLQIRK